MRVFTETGVIKRHIFLASLFLPLILCVFLVVYPVYLFESYDGKRVLQLVIVILLVFSLLNVSLANKSLQLFIFFPSSSKIAILLIFSSAAIASYFSEYSLYAWGDWIHYLLLVVALIVATAIFNASPHFIFGAFFAILIGFILLVCEFIVRCLIAFTLDGYLSALLVYPNPGNIRFLNQIHVQVFFAFPVLFFLLPAHFRKVLIFFGVVGVFMLAVAGARGAFLSIAFCVLVGYFSGNNQIKKINRLSILILLAGFALYFLYKYVYLVVMGIDDDMDVFRSGSSGRLTMWLDSFFVFKDQLLGVGPYHYGAVTEQIYFSHPHNFVVQIFLEWGLVAGLAFCFLLVCFAKFIFQVLKSCNDLKILGLAYSVLCGLAYSFFSGVFVMPASQVVFVILFAMLLSKTGGNPGRVCSIAAKNFRLYHAAFCCFLLSVAGFYIYYSHKTYSVNKKLESSGDISIYKSVGPRMWVKGGIPGLSSGKGE